MSYLYVNTYVESRRMMQVNLFAEQEKKITDTEKKRMATKGEGSGMDWESGVDMCTLLCVK